MGKIGAVLFAIAATVTIASAQQRTPGQQDLFLCGDEKMRDEIRGLLLEGLKEALKNHTENAFIVWMKDEKDQPARAARGVNQGVAAYIRAKRSVEQWTLPQC